MTEPYQYTLSELRDRFTGASEFVEALRTKSEEQLLHRPAEGAWNTSDICSHLAVFGTLFQDEAERAVEKANPAPRGEGPFRAKWVVRKLAAMMEPPYKTRLRAPAKMRPKTESPEGDGDPIGALLAVEARTRDMLARAKEEQWDLRRIKGKHPIIPLLPMSLIDLLVVIDVHRRRHFWQIEQTLPAQPGPAGAADTP